MVEPARTIEVDGDQARVASWRLHVLIEAGYPLSLAEHLAHSEIDLHRAVELDSARLLPRDGRRDPFVEPLASQPRAQRRDVLPARSRRFLTHFFSIPFSAPWERAKRNEALHWPRSAARHFVLVSHPPTTPRDDSVRNVRPRWSRRGWQRSRGSRRRAGGASSGSSGRWSRETAASVVRAWRNRLLCRRVFIPLGALGGEWNREVPGTLRSSSSYPVGGSHFETSSWHSRLDPRGRTALPE